MKWNQSATTFEQPPVGAHIAKLIRIVDIGTQESEYKGEKTVRRQNIFTWELPYELREDGQPFIISKFYTASLSEKANLTKDLTSWLGKTPTTDLDPKSLLGKDCQVVVVGRENSDKVVISSVVGLSKGQTVPKETHNPFVFFSLDPEEYDETVFDSLSNGLQQMIMRSPEYAAIVSGEFGGPEETAKAAAAGDDDIPF